MTLAPLPRWRTLARAAVGGGLDGATLAGPWSRAGDRAFWLSRSAWSLAAIANTRREVNGGGPPSVWVPDYFCNGALEPLRATGARLIFYPITPDLEPDYVACQAMSAGDPPDLFVLVHYFGSAANAEAAARFCRRADTWLIEDAAHVFQPIRGVGEHGEFVLYSPHKHLPVPDGAVLVARPEAPGISSASAAVLGVLECAHRKLIDAPSTKRHESSLWLLKRCLQKLGVGSASAGDLDHARDPSPGPPAHPRMTRIARRLISALLPSLDHVARERLLRRDVWLHLLGDGESPWAALRPDRATAPVAYLAGFSSDDEHTVSAYFREFKQRGLPVTTWPDLPPEVLGNPERHATAVRRRTQMLFLAVHQSLVVRRMAAVVGRLPTVDSSGWDLRWEDADQRVWSEWMRVCGRSNLLQHWAYGDAKQQVDSWTVRRAVVVRGQEPIAIVQVLRRDYLKVVRVTRINRGPLFIETPTEADVAATFALLARLGSWSRGRILSIAPELERDGRHAVLLAALGFRPASGTPWSSAWVDLSPDLAVVRASLDKKWRNMLTSAEKATLAVEEGSGDELFDWLIAGHAEHMGRRHFSGPSVSVLRAFRGAIEGRGDVRILRATHDGIPVAGVCFIRHGVASTYVVGWATEAGRKVRASHLLLWHAVITSKEAGCRWLDLGGIDEIATPGVAAFKLGMNGRRYTLIGEYIRA